MVTDTASSTDLEKQQWHVEIPQSTEDSGSEESRVSYIP
jgi:hypothetical protein